MRIALLLLGLGLIGSLLFGHHQYRKASRWNGIKLEHAYDPARDITITRLKANDRLLDVGYDRNGDLENDSLVGYAANGSVSHVWMDEDFDGIYEVLYQFDTAGKLVARYEDIGQDGYFNECIRYQGDSIIIYRDIDGDQWFSDHEFVRKGLK